MGVSVLNQIHEPRTVAPGAALPHVVRAQVEALVRENAQLQEALSSRIVIEQAKGVLMERYRLAPTRAFELLRRAARDERRRIHDLAAEVVGNRCSPDRIEALALETGTLEEAGVSGG